MTPSRFASISVLAAACLSFPALVACDKSKDADAADAAEADDAAAPEPAEVEAADDGDSSEAAETGAPAGETGDAAEAETGDAAEGETGDAAGDADADADADADPQKDEGGETAKKQGGGEGGGDGNDAAMLAQGKELFGKKCKACHGLDGKGSEKFKKKVPDLPSLASTKLGKAKIVSVVTDGVPDTKMKAYKTKLSAEEIEAVSLYVKKKL